MGSKPSKGNQKQSENKPVRVSVKAAKDKDPYNTKGESHGSPEADSSNDGVNVPASLPGYPPPVPQELSIDQIRTPIPWYQPEVDQDEFNWQEVENDLQEHDNNTIISKFPKNYANPGAPITPRSVLINSPLSSAPLTNRGLVTPSGRKISFVSQERTRSSIMRGNNTISQGGLSIHGIPRRAPPKKGSLSFSQIDGHARSTSKEHLETFTALIDYLKKPIRFHRLSELMTARALIVWLANQEPRKTMTRKEATTPKGLLDLLARGVVTYSTAYVILCREAGLRCVLIDGIARRTEFIELPEEECQHVADTWTAVYVEADWQIVHPFWICKGVHGLGGSLDAWIAQEVENEDKRERANVIRRLKLQVKHFINEDFFMPTPEQLIYFNYADDTRWQLLGDYTVRSRDDFMSLPLLFPAFYRFGLKLRTEPCCILKSTNGKIKIWISAEWGNAHLLTFTYELNLLESQCANSKIILNDLDRMVIHSRHNDLIYFEIRFPIEGVFSFEINGGFYKSHALRLCHFKLICEERRPYFKYLPFNPYHLMWGPGPVSNDYGLVLPSKPTGIIKVYPNIQLNVPTQGISSHSNLRQPATYKEHVFSFELNSERAKTVDFSADLLGFLPDDVSAEVTPLDETGNLVDKSRRKRKKGTVQPDQQDYGFCVNCFKSKSQRQLHITVRIPHEGEFALTIKAVPFTVADDTQARQYGTETVVCAYLLWTCDDIHRETVHQRLARAELQAMMKSNQKNPDKVFKALEKCAREKISPHDDEIEAGRTRAEYLEMKRGIFDAIHRRNFRVVSEQLVKVSKYRHKGALLAETRRLFTLRNQLKQLLVFPSYISELRRAGDELLYMDNPAPEVHLTMGALFLLLEEQDKSIEVYTDPPVILGVSQNNVDKWKDSISEEFQSWPYIVQQLSNESVYKKMALIADMSPSKNTRRKILTLLAEFPYERVNALSDAAGKFYVWTQKVMGILEDIDFDTNADEQTNEEGKDDETDDVTLAKTSKPSQLSKQE